MGKPFQSFLTPATEEEVAEFQSQVKQLVDPETILHLTYMKNGGNLGLVFKRKKVVISPLNHMLCRSIRIASRRRF